MGTACGRTCTYPEDEVMTSTIIGVRLLTVGYHVTFLRSDRYVYSETWMVPPDGYHVDRY